MDALFSKSMLAEPIVKTVKKHWNQHLSRSFFTIICHIWVSLHQKHEKDNLLGIRGLWKDVIKKLDTMLFSYSAFSAFGFKWESQEVHVRTWPYLNIMSLLLLHFGEILRCIEGHEDRNLIYKLKHAKLLVFSLKFFSWRKSRAFPKKN